jgi:hypothetical protein
MATPPTIHSMMGGALGDLGDGFLGGSRVQAVEIVNRRPAHWENDADRDQLPRRTGSLDEAPGLPNEPTLEGAAALRAGAAAATVIGLTGAQTSSQGCSPRKLAGEPPQALGAELTPQGSLLRGRGCRPRGFAVAEPELSAQGLVEKSLEWPAR